MAATARSTSLVPVQPVFTDAERLALAGVTPGRLHHRTVRSRRMPAIPVSRCDKPNFDLAKDTAMCVIEIRPEQGGADAAALRGRWSSQSGPGRRAT